MVEQGFKVKDTSMVL